MYACARIDDRMDGVWSSGAACGPKLAALIDGALEAEGWTAAAAFNGRLGASAAPPFPEGSFKIFSTCNIGLVKARNDAAGWMKAGPVRPPYKHPPEACLARARKSGQMLAEIEAGLRCAARRFSGR